MGYDCTIDVKIYCKHAWLLGIILKTICSIILLFKVHNVIATGD